MGPIHDGRSTAVPSSFAWIFDFVERLTNLRTGQRRQVNIVDVGVVLPTVGTA